MSRKKENLPLIALLALSLGVAGCSVKKDIQKIDPEAGQESSEGETAGTDGSDDSGDPGAGEEMTEEELYQSLLIQGSLIEQKKENLALAAEDLKRAKKERDFYVVEQPRYLGVAILGGVGAVASAAATLKGLGKTKEAKALQKTIDGYNASILENIAVSRRISDAASPKLISDARRLLRKVHKGRKFKSAEVAAAFQTAKIRGLGSNLDEMIDAAKGLKAMPKKPFPKKRVGLLVASIVAVGVGVMGYIERDAEDNLIVQLHEDVETAKEKVSINQAAVDEAEQALVARIEMEKESGNLPENLADLDTNQIIERLFAKSDDDNGSDDDSEAADSDETADTAEDPENEPAEEVAKSDLNTGGI